MLRLFRKYKKSGREESVQPDFSRLPRHVAIMMDGNGRWATMRGLARTAGHSAGSETFRNIATICNDIGIEYLTVYAFSTENWSRPKAEVDTIFALLGQYLREAIEEIPKKNISLRIIGDQSPLPDELKTLIRRTDALSVHSTGLRVNVCINYGGRAELVHAVRRIVASGVEADSINEAMVSANLDTAGIPDPDLIIRPSGEIRTSNFLLWESAYAEYYFTPVLWPDFDRDELYRAIASYQARSRRFGAV